MASKLSWIVITGLLALLVLSACNAPATPAPDAAGAVTAQTAIDQYVGETATIDSPDDLLTTAVQVTGTTQAYALTGGNPPCPGYVNTIPSYVFDVTADLGKLTISFTGSGDATLATVTPTGDILCGDAAASGLKPVQEIAAPAHGRYGVWVGRIQMAEELAGALEVQAAP
jgi:hypothetical protein